MKTDNCLVHQTHDDGRRRLLRSAAHMAAMGTLSGLTFGVPESSLAAALSEETRNQLTAEQIIEMMKQGNARFRNGRMLPHDYLAQKRSSLTAQYPAAVILSCMDSRAPAEIVLDAGIGDMFNVRVAGSVANDDVIGSLEFACAIAGAKVVLVMGHTSCGAIKGAIDGAELGHLTGLLKNIKPIVDATAYMGDRTSKNEAFVDEVAKTHVETTMYEIRRRSHVLAALEQDGSIKLVGAMYHLVGGLVDFFI